IGAGAALFEAVHGSAPDIAGKNLANPTAVIMAGVMLLHHLGEHSAADKIQAAVEKVVTEGVYVTPDLNAQTKAGTIQMGDAIARELQKA
ncbi:MAG: isocitrate/isopropylmalate family dehydrogenase, partial [Methylococcales bacterium]